MKVSSLKGQAAKENPPKPDPANAGSPLAEGILRKKARAAGLHPAIDSAGTNGHHTGEAPHHLSRKVARLNGLDISTQRARRFTADDFQQFDKRYAMAGDVVDDMRRIDHIIAQYGKAEKSLSK